MKPIRKRREDGCPGLPERAKNYMVVRQFVQAGAATALPNLKIHSTTAIVIQFILSLMIGDF